MATHNIKANIQGLGDDEILVSYYPILTPDDNSGDSVQDTLVAKEGYFTCNIPGAAPLMVYLMPKKAIYTRRDGSPYWAREKAIIVLVKPGDKLEIEGELKELYMDYTVKGTEFNEQYTKVRKSYIEAVSEAVAVELQLDTLIANNGDKTLINELFQKRNRIKGIGGEAKLEYVKNNLNKDLAAYFLLDQSWENLGKLYPALAPDVRNGLFKTMLESQLDTYDKYTKIQKAKQIIKEGETAPEFKLPSLAGDFALNTVKGRYIVLDFWGSWCAPCVKGFPKMKEYYSKYKGSIEFIGIDCNETEEAWRTAVQKHELLWPQVIDTSETEANVAVRYGVEAYPTKFILDQDKKIIAKFIGEDDSFYKKLDELMEAK
ncbi:TlpA disulfide reductase family protein [Pontibacter sp. SGAir0037]|uniref:TlpA disulfide reductase family protein n=1 Tax=Pontibacter sp. SGAir0037 TaxID=2571030 RepID=UPI0010CD091B|nr:TlpA disulfide reductase family protein [Pontibacter sp. SGAir0037]QCR23396.1 hypothetical protein C1N53_14310 [Pontibacter sp. SGAir0037]